MYIETEITYVYNIYIYIICVYIYIYIYIICIYIYIYMYTYTYNRMPEMLSRRWVREALLRALAAARRAREPYIYIYIQYA